MNIFSGLIYEIPLHVFYKHFYMKTKVLLKLFGKNTERRKGFRCTDA